ncbi:MAG: hypothetical protein WD823_07150 [Sulfuricaulis sp.]|uniref:hypothetical protein n=1 Tax=Sulfuricaulis sp. TaxID=2003553 RepID=UPI0034A4E9F3
MAHILIAELRKLLHDRKRKAIAVLLVGIVATAIAALLPASELSINDSCEVSGPIQRLKSIIQGKRFWVKQLQLLDNEVRHLEELPERIRSTQVVVNEKTKDILKQNERFMEEQYSKHPKLRPSPQQALADELRRQADAIEHAQLLQTLEQINAKRIGFLKSCRRAILAAAQ